MHVDIDLGRSSLFVAAVHDSGEARALFALMCQETNAILREEQSQLSTWRREYNKERPHGGLGQMPPAEYRASLTEAEDAKRLAISL